MEEGVTGRLRVLGGGVSEGVLVVAAADDGPPWTLHLAPGRGRVGPLWVDGSPRWLAPLPPVEVASDDDPGDALDFDPTHPLTGAVLVVAGAPRAGPSRARLAGVAGVVLLFGLAAGRTLVSAGPGTLDLRLDEAGSATLVCPGLEVAAERGRSGTLRLPLPDAPASCTLSVTLGGREAVRADVALAPGRGYTCRVSSGFPGSLSCVLR